MSQARTKLPPPPEDEELDMGEDEEFDEEEGVDIFEALGSLLATEDGETIATSLAGLKDSTDKIALSLEMQNKILVKLLSAVQKMSPCACTAAPAPPAEAA
jgi:hypothetical protein